MKRTALTILLFYACIVQIQAQTFEEEVKKISKKIDQITRQQKDSLKIKVRDINLQLEEGQISKTKGDQLKKEAAIYHAQRIESMVVLQEKKLQKLIQDKVDGKILDEDHYYEKSTFSIGSRTVELRLNKEDDYERQQRKRRDSMRSLPQRTTNQFVFAMGFNNVLIDSQLSSLNTSPYQNERSRFYEVGFTRKYRLQKDPSKAYLKYGLSLLWNNLRPEGNLYHVVDGNQTSLENFQLNLSESRLRHVQMTFPVHLEFDFSKDSAHDDDAIQLDNSNRSFRIGFGGFIGFKMGTRQYLEYRDAYGTRIEELQKGGFNQYRYPYGISSYLAYRSLGLYVKYDLNPLFRDTSIRNISMGVRLDLE